MRFIPVTCEEQVEMLVRIGVDSVDALFEDIPGDARLARPLGVPDGMTEIELAAHLESLAARNSDGSRVVSFLGAGVYDHYIPAIVDAVVSKPAFFTAYTPYQPEVSQGTLQAVYEYQSMICQLTGMEVSNASMYDGATAFAEAALMAARVTKRGRVVVSGAVHPEWREVLATYVESGTLDVVEVPASGGVTDAAAVAAVVDDSTAALMVTSPTWYGTLEDLTALGVLAHDAGALFVVGTNPILLGVMEPPASYGADIVVGEGQPLGNAISFGGPGLGIFACHKAHIRQMPGRIAGRTTDVDGRPGFVLTFSTREQHIRREKATSNICSNHALNALASGVYLAALGTHGLAGIGEACIAKAHYLEDALVGCGCFERVYGAPFANEFTLRYRGEVADMQTRLLERGFLAGLDLGRFDADDAGLVLFAVTERHTREVIDRFVEEVSAL
ncbi:MAG: aminomethyl-transferring glycine dehydrogenase subunit GcvPA [Coriobacteriia bacterium]|nr:aminomethyl-transferring glycine dehydrogenase subunit GcvPA [Coriobacteriia bacterium]MBN2840142.1 aminomethyl-transferring glycine dehydrogenase subunit GcvPA [Coriobacteriia bacterium]